MGDGPTPAQTMTMPPTSETRVSIGPSSYVSLGLVLSLIVGALFYGRQLQRLDSIEAQLRELSSEVREFRSFVVRSQSLGR